MHNDSMVEKLRRIMFEEPTRWAELLLGFVKLMLGLSLVGYLWDPPKTTEALTASAAATIGLVIGSLGAAQLVTVVLEWKWPRFIVSCAATGMWIFFMGSQWVATTSVRSILIFIPLLIFNIVVALRIARVRRHLEEEDE